MEEIKSLMQDLADAIDKSIAESERIAVVMEKIKRAGFDVLLVFEAQTSLIAREGDPVTGETEVGVNLPIQ